MKVFWFCFPLIASLFKKHGSTVKPNMYVQLYILFYVKHVIGKTHFLLKPQDLSEEKLFFFFFFLAQVVHELLNIFLCFSS